MSARTVQYAWAAQREKETKRSAGLSEVLERDWWYAIGFAAADGCLSRLPSGTTRIQLLSTDRQILDDMKPALRIPTEVRTATKALLPRKECFVLAYANKDFAQRFLEAGLIPAKSTTMGVLKVPQEHRPDFLRGYCDGDGHIHPGVNGVNVAFVGGSETFMLWLRATLQEYGDFRISRYDRKDRKGTWWNVYASSKAAIPFLKSTYGRPGLVLTRKLEQARKFL